MKLIKRQSCPSCHGKNSIILVKEPYSNPGIQNFLLSFYGEQGNPSPYLLKDEIFQIEECGNCEMIFQSYIPDNQSLNLLYTEWISFEKAFIKYEKYRSISKLDLNYAMLRDVCLYLNKRDLKCFDYGFGHAHLLKQAKIFGMDVYGVELNKNQSQQGINLGIKIINFDSELLPKMDIIFCEQVLEHTVDPRLVMEDIVKISKKGTLLHLSVPDCKNVKKLLNSLNWNNLNGNRKLIMPFVPLEHINCFNHNILVQFAQSFGFRKVDLKNTSIILGFTLRPVKFLKYLAHFVKVYLRKISSPETTELYFIYEK
jgi:hypothetical protein